MPRPLFALALACLAALAGCSLGDCDFETSRTETVGGLLVADARAVGDTLTIAFVVDAGPGLAVQVDDGALGAGVTPDRAAEVLYDATALTISGDRLPRPLDVAVVGDTAYVYPAGALDGLAFACSPPSTVVDLRVRQVLLPDGVVGRTALVTLNDVPVAATAEAARRRRAALVRA